MISQCQQCDGEITGKTYVIGVSAKERRAFCSVNCFKESGMAVAWASERYRHRKIYKTGDKIDAN